MASVKRTYRLELVVADTTGMMSEFVRGSALSGELTVEGEQKVFLENRGIITVSGIIDKNNPMSEKIGNFKEQMPISTNKVIYEKSNEKMTIRLEASMDNLMSNTRIDDIRLKIERKGVLSFLGFKSLTLKGIATAV